MTERPSFRENITTRYGTAEKGTYNRVMVLAKRRGIGKSRAQLYLIQQGLKREKLYPEGRPK